MKTKKNLESLPKKKTGAPTKYNKDIYPHIVKAIASKGYIESEIQDIIKISVATFVSWKKLYPEFLKALKDGKETPDNEVENALLKRAKGYEYDEIIERPKIIKRNNKPVEVMRVSEIKHKVMAPEVIAQIFWLKNRRPDRWRDRQDIEHSGTIGYKVIPDDLSEIIEEETKE